MAKSRHLLLIAFLSSSLALVAQVGAQKTQDLKFGVVNFQTISVASSGESHMKGGIVLRVTNSSTKIQSFGISNETGILVMPLPAGEYCYDAFSDTGRAFTMTKKKEDRCFAVKHGTVETVGVGVIE